MRRFFCFLFTARVHFCLFFLLLGASIVLNPMSSTAQEAYKNPSLSFDERAQDLLSKLTLEEKISLMCNNSPGVERLGIRPYDWWNEALHGVARAGKATVFPQAIGMAATFDDQALKETFSIISDEARAKYNDFQKSGLYSGYKGLTFWTPNINIFRDPRWGRGMETYGEDPYLTSRMGLAVVRGLQGEPSSGIKYDKTHACAKHYAVHSGPEWNRHSFDAKNISLRDLNETYLPAFKTLVTEGDVKEVMCAYNSFDGEPCCSSDRLLVNILRNEWGFDGIVVSDCGAIADFYRDGAHKTHPSAAAASADAVVSGTDLNCGGTYHALNDAVKKGLITEKEIDKSVFRLLRARFELGMFDDDALVGYSQIPYSVVECNAHKTKALEMAQKSMVLLSNKNNTLPLNKKLRKIAVIGPNANDSVMLWANYNGTPTKSVTILDGIIAKLSPEQVIYEKGCDYVSDRVFQSYFDQFKFNGKSGFKATFWNNKELAGEAVANTWISTPPAYNGGGGTRFEPNVNLEDFSARFESEFIPQKSEKVVFRIEGDDAYRVFVDGKEVISEWNNGASRLRDCELSVVKNQKYKIVVEYYQAGGDASLRFDIGLDTQLDYNAVVERVKDADAIIFVGGISASLEGEEMGVKLPGFNGGDRTDIELPKVQKKMLSALKASGKPLVFVLCTGSAIALPEEKEISDAMLCAWYPGQEGGEAVADVLFGDYNPAGRLPITFYAASSDLPDFEDYNMNEGRTYRYFKGKPLFPFGYGMSYSTFSYSKAKLDRAKIRKGESTSLKLYLKNTNKVAGEEVIQIYVRNLQDAEGPIKSLRAFKRVALEKGEGKFITIDLSASSFEFFNPMSGKMEVRPGEYEILYGGTSDEQYLKKIPLVVY